MMLMLVCSVICISIVCFYFVICVWYFRLVDGYYMIGYMINIIEVNLVIVIVIILVLWLFVCVWFLDVFELMGINWFYFYLDIEV